MGLTAAVTSGTPSASSLSLISTVGVGAGGIFVTALLVYLLAYLNVVEASERNRQHLQSLLVVASIPLAFVFVSVVAFKTLTILGYL